MGANAKPVQSRFALNLTQESDHFSLPFTVRPEAAPAVLHVSVHSGSWLKKLKVQATLEKRAKSQVLQDIDDAREAAKRALRPNERVVELTKDANGLGFAIGFDV